MNLPGDVETRDLAAERITPHFDTRSRPTPRPASRLSPSWVENPALKISAAWIAFVSNCAASCGLTSPRRTAAVAHALGDDTLPIVLEDQFEALVPRPDTSTCSTPVSFLSLPRRCGSDPRCRAPPRYARAGCAMSRTVLRSSCGHAARAPWRRAWTFLPRSVAMRCASASRLVAISEVRCTASR